MNHRSHELFPKTDRVFDSLLKFDQHILATLTFKQHCAKFDASHAIMLHLLNCYAPTARVSKEKNTANVKREAMKTK
jgi:hypothetical protein